MQYLKFDNWIYRDPVRLCLMVERMRLKLSIRKLAERAEVSPSSLSEAEHGGVMGVKNARLVAGVLNTTYWKILEVFQYVEDEEGKRFVGEDGTVYQASEVEEYIGRNYNL